MNVSFLKKIGQVAVEVVKDAGKAIAVIGGIEPLVEQVVHAVRPASDGTVALVESEFAKAGKVITDIEQAAASVNAAVPTGQSPIITGAMKLEMALPGIMDAIMDSGLMKNRTIDSDKIAQAQAAVKVIAGGLADLLNTVSANSITVQKKS